MNKQKFKINSIDLLLLTFALLVVSIIAIATFSGNALIDISKKEALQITVSIPDVDKKHANLIKNEDKVYLSRDENVSGVIVSSYTSSVKKEFSDTKTGRSRTMSLPDKVNTNITIVCDGVKNGNSYSISGIKYKKGDEIVISSPEFSGVGIITDISIGDK